MSKTVRDAVHGDMRFDAHELAVIDTPGVQRLRGIKQLGTSNLVFPSAVHTRFEHSLGTCWMTKRLLAALAEAGHEVTEAERRTACLAALLHDITHVPFGHTFEDERRLFERHDEDPGRLAHFLEEPRLAAALAATGVAAEVRQLLAGDKARRSQTGEHPKVAVTKPPLPSATEAGPAPFLRQLVTGTVCADLLDYLRRDALHCGLHLAYDDRVLAYCSLVDRQWVIRLHKGGVLRRDALSELVHLLQIRYTLTERVYYHHAKVAAGAMVSRALELALAAGRVTREELYDLRDDSLLDRLQQRSAAVPGLGDVLADLSTRRLYKRVYFLQAAGLGRVGLTPAERTALAARFHYDLAARAAAEAALAERLGVPSAHVILYCPAPTMALKEADVPVEVEPGVVVPLSALGHPDIAALGQKHQGLWRFYMLLRRDHESSATRAGEFAAEVVGHANQLGQSAKMSPKVGGL